jgi:hypothetical protein
MGTPNAGSWIKSKLISLVSVKVVRKDNLVKKALWDAVISTL